LPALPVNPLMVAQLPPSANQQNNQWFLVE
jgi:hypothetical protein